jgi:hypothetical protein
MTLPTPRPVDEVLASLVELTDTDQRAAYITSIAGLTPAHRAHTDPPHGVMWTNARGLWKLTINFRDMGYQPVIQIDMPMPGGKTTLPLPDHDIDYVRAALTILGAVEPE